MERYVYSLHHVELRHHDVIVILLSWNQFPTKINEEIKLHSSEFERAHCAGSARSQVHRRSHVD
jgi:hypothetical protein